MNFVEFLICFKELLEIIEIFQNSKCKVLKMCRVFSHVNKGVMYCVVPL